MTVMNFDLEDGLPPVSFDLKPADAERFAAFMAECYAALAAARTPPAQDEPVASLYVSRFRGHLENTQFEYLGELPDGTYNLYTHPADDKLRKAAEEALAVLEDYHASETDIAATIKKLRAALDE